MTKDEMVGWHHKLNKHEYEQILRDNEGQGSLACCSHAELDMIAAEQQQQEAKILQDMWRKKKCRK